MTTLFSADRPYNTPQELPVRFAARGSAAHRWADKEQRLKVRLSRRTMWIATHITLLTIGLSCSVESPSPEPSEGAESTARAERKPVPKDDRLKIVRSQGQVDFALMSGEASEDAGLMERLSRLHCNQRRPEFCRVMIWKDASSVPRSLPMSDAQLMAQVAQYNRNRQTAYDCFFLMKKGEMVDSSRSEGCT